LKICNKEHPFTCKEHLLQSGNCMFHDEQFLNSNANNYSQNLKRITKRFNFKLNECMKNNKDLLFIGYIYLKS